MRKSAALLASALLMAASTLAHADGPDPDLAWLAGHWCSGDAGERIEETWLAPHGGELLGLSRTLKGERSVAFEFLRIASVDGVQTYLAQPGGRPPTGFALGAAGKDWVRFENPEHDFPQRIEYRREGDRLRAEIAGPGEQGKEMVITFEYLACPG